MWVVVGNVMNVNYCGVSWGIQFDVIVEHCEAVFVAKLLDAILAQRLISYANRDVKA